MAAAYPTLDGDDTCQTHRHEPRVVGLARVIAGAVHETEPSDEQIAWFLDDADAVVDDFDPTPERWDVVLGGIPKIPGIDHEMTVNGVAYVVPASEWEPATPIKRETWLREQRDEDSA